MEKPGQNTTERLFNLGMWWRIIYGTVRIALGVELLRLVGTSFMAIFERFARGEMAEDPSDFFVVRTAHLLSAHPMEVTYFLAVYFIFWGMVDVGLSWNLLKKKLWAFPASFALIVGFVSYQIWRFFHTHSLILLWIIFVDIVILYLIYREYQKLKKRAVRAYDSDLDSAEEERSQE